MPIWAEKGYTLTCTGSIAAGKAAGPLRRRIRNPDSGYTIRDAEFSGGRMLPCSAVLADDNGYAYTRHLADCILMDGACGACVRGRQRAAPERMTRTQREKLYARPAA